MKSLICLIFILSSLSGYSLAEEAPLWKRVGSWEVRVDTTLDNGCFTYQLYESETYVRFGIDKTNGGTYLLIGDPDWKSLEPGKEYLVELTFGNETPWEADATAVEFVDIPSLYIYATSGDSALLFLEEFMSQTTLDVEHKGSSIAYLSLSGTYEAGLAIIECQSENDSGGQSLDPFDDSGNSPESNKDPFSI